MPGEIPDATFRIEHSFAAKPELTVDEGPNKGILAGANARGAYEAIYLGKHAESPFRNVWLDIRGAHAVYVMGKRRSGKSYTLGALAEGLAASGWIRQGELSQGILILDTMNVYMTMPFGVSEALESSNEAVRELRKWKLSAEQPPMSLFRPRGTEVPDAIPTTEVSLRASDLGADEWCGMFEADPFADPLGHLITELHAKVSADGWVDSRTEHTIAPNTDFVLSDLLDALLYDVELQRYRSETREALRRRFESIRRLPIFSDEGLDLRQLIRPGHISVLLLRELDPQLRGSMVALIVKKLMQLRGTSEQHERVHAIHQAHARKLAEDGDAAGEQREVAAAAEALRKAQQGLPRTWLIIDEAHNYIPASGFIASRRPLKKYVDEGRNLGLSIVVATQQPSGLDPSIQRNADLLIVHSLSHKDDISAAEGMINTAPPTEVAMGTRYRFEGARSFEALVRSLPLGYALVSSDRANRLFPVRIRPRVTVHGGGEY
jgi:uncharacterized protein